MDPGLPILAVTVNYGTPELTLRALASLAAERSSVPGLRAVCVDNASPDDSLERLRRAVDERGWAGWARVVASPLNAGFGAGNNLALRPALADREPPAAVLLLNPDVELAPGAVVALETFLREHPRAGLVGPRTEIGRGNHRGTAFRFPGILNSLDEGLAFGPVARLLAPWRLAPDPRSEPHRTDWLSGGCLLVRREVFADVGLFDEGFFLYFEEVELSRRAAAAGWESWYVPSASVVHDAGAATGVTGADELASPTPRYWFESRRRYFDKTRGPLVGLAADLAWLLGAGLYGLRRLLGAAPRHPPGHLRDFVRHLLLPRFNPFRTRGR